jgi:hypothetical protein
MAESGTRPTTVSAAQFLAAVPDPQRRADSEALVRIFQRATGEPPVMWGPSIVGFGSYHYVYDSGREGDMCLVGFSPRRSALVLYVRSGAEGEASLLARLGKHTAGKGCLYVKRLGDVDLGTLEALVRASAAHVRARAQCDVCVTSRAEQRARRPAKEKVAKAAKQTAVARRRGATPA